MWALRPAVQLIHFGLKRSVCLISEHFKTSGKKDVCAAILKSCQEGSYLDFPKTTLLPREEAKVELLTRQDKSMPESLFATLAIKLMPN